MIKFFIKIYHILEMRKQIEMIKWDILVMESILPKKEARVKLLTGLNESDNKQIESLKDDHTHEGRKQRETLEKNVKDRTGEINGINNQIIKVQFENQNRRSEIGDYINRINIVKAN